MSRGSYLKVIKRNGSVLVRIREIKSDHPFWGYRRVWAHLKYVDGLSVNQKRVYRLMKEHDLLVRPNLRLKATRSHQKPKPRPQEPNEWWGIDMTKVMIPVFGWIYVVFVLDWYTKKIVGHYAGIQCKTKHWLQALDKAVNLQFPKGIRSHKVSLMSDNGSQPTSMSFMKSCQILGIQQAFTSYNNPKGNADTERLMRTFKEELVWLHEWSSPIQFMKELARWVNDYNEKYLHSTLGYQPPLRFEKQYQINQISLLAQA